MYLMYSTLMDRTVLNLLHLQIGCVLFAGGLSVSCFRDLANGIYKAKHHTAPDVDRKLTGRSRARKKNGDTKNRRRSSGKSMSAKLELNLIICMKVGAGNMEC